MKTLVSSATLALAIAGCAVPSEQEQAGDRSSEPDLDKSDGDDSHDDGPPPVPGCLGVTPTGTVELELILGETNDFAQRADVDVDHSDNVLHALPRTARSPLSGLTKLSNDLVTLYARPFGDLVATDGDSVFVTGMFDRTIDFGFGPDAPHGDGHAYLVKLDHNGQTLFAKELYPCGTLAVVSIAVDSPRGRVAVSGLDAGTLMLDAGDGRELFRVAAGGDVAFDSQGNIIITGELAGDAFVAKHDAWGQQLFRVTFSESAAPEHAALGANRQAGVAVTVDGEDNIIVAGEFETTIQLFGDSYFIGGGGEVGDLDGGFVLKLDPHGALVWKQVRDAQDIADVAVDPLNHVLVSGSQLASLSPFSHPFVFKLDATTGAFRWLHSELPGIGYGTAGGIASDSCGNAFWATTARVTFDETVLARAFLLKLAL